VAARWEYRLQKWVNAGLIDAGTAERIRAHEAEQGQALRWPIRLALSLGVILLGTGVLLFVSARWDGLSPALRFLLVLLLVSVFHVAGAFAAEHFENLAIALHALGTVTLGAGIFLTGQIFNLAEHWPGGVMLWAIGAWLAWVVRRDVAQTAFVALLTPAWLASEWLAATESSKLANRVLAEGLVLLSLTYFTAWMAEKLGPLRRTLAIIGAITILPTLLYFIFTQQGHYHFYHTEGEATLFLLVVRVLAWVAPLLLAVAVRKRAAWMNLCAAAWLAVFGLLRMESGNVLVYLWVAAGAGGLIAWGVTESHRERIDLGFLVFGVTVLVFYFSNVFDKLGRAASLISLGLLFLGGGWALERARRRLVAKVKRAQS